MADKNRYPQIPATVWWGVRSILQRSPSATIDARLLGVQLNVQEAAARQYVVELQNVGIITDEGRATPLAQKWRLDPSYSAAVKELIAATYPQGLLDAAPPGENDRQKIVNWFMHDGLGQGAAGNKAATYLLLSSPSPNEAPSRAASKATKEATPNSGKQAAPRQPREARIPKEVTDRRPEAGRSTGRMENMPLNINVQIHISADAGSEQIESIFSAMKRYLNASDN